MSENPVIEIKVRDYGTMRAELYPKNRRDAIIINGISTNLPVAKINESLYDNGENTLN